MSDLRPLASRSLLALIIAIYFIVGTAYAVETPKWEVPDEPAHYNYILYLAQNYRFPVLQMGDYPHQYLEEIKAARFPPNMSIDPLRYEFHQPPLYYLLAAGLHKATAFLGFEGQFLILRLFSVLLGCFVLLVAYAIVKGIFPDQAFLALTTAGLIATVPMHIAMSAAINNDALAELILALILWLCIIHLKAGLTQRQILLLGVLLGLALLTKTTIYAPSILAIILTLGVRAKTEGGPAFLRQLGFISCLALLSSPWFLRNVLTYGDMDLFGWQRHDAIVVGQPTTAEWINQYGISKVIQDFFTTSFRSFWAQFGWMGILVDSRLYELLAITSVILGLGFILLLTDIARNPRVLSPSQWWALSILLLVLLLVAAGHVLYNLKFVQHQGRYLFPALVPIGLGLALGLREWVTTVVHPISRLGFLQCPAEQLTHVAGVAAFSAFYAGLLALDLVCLYKFIVPYFQG